MSVAIRLLLIVLSAGVAGCEPLAPTAATAPLAIDLPAPLVSEVRVEDPILWSPDGGTIYFIDLWWAPPYGRIRAADTRTGITRLVNSAVRNAGAFQVSGAGEYVYTMASNEELVRSDIVRIPVGGGPAELVEADASGALALSANGRMLAWSRNDSLHVRDLVSGRTRVVARQGEPILVTDDGEHVAHREFSANWELQFAAISMTTGVPTAFAARWPCDVRWSGSRFEVAGNNLSGWGLVIEREPGALVELLPRSRTHGVQGCDWSPDGRYVAATWVSVCPGKNNPSLEECHAQLLLVDTTTGNVATLATSGAHMGRPNFSPDGRRIAFTSGGRLYVRDVPFVP